MQGDPVWSPFFNQYQFQMKGTFPIEKFEGLRTPFYYYDTHVLRDTLQAISDEAGRYERFQVHYAIKANANPRLLTLIRQAGLGADCVSGGEIEAALSAGRQNSQVKAWVLLPNGMQPPSRSD